MNRHDLVGKEPKPRLPRNQVPVVSLEPSAGAPPRGHPLTYASLPRIGERIVTTDDEAA